MAFLFDVLSLYICFVSVSKAFHIACKWCWVHSIHSVLCHAQRKIVSSTAVGNNFLFFSFSFYKQLNISTTLSVIVVIIVSMLTKWFHRSVKKSLIPFIHSWWFFVWFPNDNIEKMKKNRQQKHFRNQNTIQLKSIP